MKIQSTELSFYEIRDLVNEWCADIKISAIDIVNMTGHVISRGKNKGKRRSVCSFKLRPIKGSDKWRKCRKIYNDEKPFARTAHACWMGHVHFGRCLLNYLRSENSTNDLQFYAGGKRHEGIGSMIEYIENGERAYWTGDDGSCTKYLTSFNTPQSSACMCRMHQDNKKNGIVPCYESFD